MCFFNLVDLQLFTFYSSRVALKYMYLGGKWNRSDDFSHVTKIYRHGNKKSKNHYLFTWLGCCSEFKITSFKRLPILMYLIYYFNTILVGKPLKITLLWLSEPHKTVQKTTKTCQKGYKKTPKSNEIGVFSAIY